MGDVKFGIWLPGCLYYALRYNFKDLNFEALKDISLKAERLGYHSLWSPDHLSYNEIRERLESWTLLSALSSITNNIRLGTIVLCNLYRHPAIVAKMTSTLDVISKGRLEFGIGAGWNEIECSSIGIKIPKPKRRLGMLKESVEIIKKLWTEERTTYFGKYYTIKDAYCDPKPVQKPHPPIMIGGGGEKTTLRIVARHANISNFGGPPSILKQKMDLLRMYCDKIDRDYESIVKSMRLQVIIAPTHEDYLVDMKKRYLATSIAEPFGDWLKKAESQYITGVPEECIGRIKEYVELGVSLFILDFGKTPETDDMELFAKEVIPEVKKFRYVA